MALLISCSGFREASSGWVPDDCMLGAAVDVEGSLASLRLTCLSKSSFIDAALGCFESAILIPVF